MSSVEVFLAGDVDHSTNITGIGDWLDYDLWIDGWTATGGVPNPWHDHTHTWSPCDQGDNNKKAVYQINGLSLKLKLFTTGDQKQL
jgi:hypothetical protein